MNAHSPLKSIDRLLFGTITPYSRHCKDELERGCCVHYHHITELESEVLHDVYTKASQVVCDSIVDILSEQVSLDELGPLLKFIYMFWVKGLEADISKLERKDREGGYMYGV